MYAVEMENINKTFPGGVQANKDITLRIREGEVHALLGENGAGKSTLMNVLYGLLAPDSGRIVIRGEEVKFNSPRDAIAHGIGMVHQHFKLIPILTVTENVMLGSEALLGSSSITAKARVDGVLPLNFPQAAKEIRRIGKENSLEVDPRAKIQDLSVGFQQRVEIIKLLYRKADILILDEPTAVLTPQEVDDLFVTLEAFRKSGKTIVLITHKLREPMALADRITVLRDGELVGTVNKAETTREALAEMMVGRPVVFRVKKTEATPGQSILRIDNLWVKDDRGLDAVKEVSFEVRCGEILGLAGVEGNGQQELVEAIVGLRKIESGDVWVEDTRITKFNPRKVRRAGLGYIPQDRQGRGLIMDFSIKENLILGEHTQEPFASKKFFPLSFVLPDFSVPLSRSRSFLNDQNITNTSQQLVSDYSIKIGEINDPMTTLSGGNQQKIVVARALGFNPRIVVASQPTRGLDVGATEYIHNVLIRMRDEGVAVFLVSADLDEIRNLSDRIAVIFEGEIVAMKDPDETDEQELGLLMAGEQTDSTMKEVSQ